MQIKLPGEYIRESEVNLTSAKIKCRQSLGKRRPLLVAASLLGATFSVAQSATAQINAPYQSAARPFGLSIVDTVKKAGSDSTSAAFQSNDLVNLRQLAMLNLPEGRPLTDKTVTLHKVNPEQLFLQTEADVRCYFVGEGAGYHNSLGFNTSGGGITGGDPKLIFPDASSSVNFMNPTQTVGSRSTSEPLLPGDFVNLGHMSAMTQLNFFLIANGAYGGRNVYSTEHDLNPDRIPHAVAYVLPDSPYLLIGFEDLYGGGDRDYNDVMFTLNIGRANAAHLAHLSGPEPATWAALLCGLAFVGRRKSRGRRLSQ